MIFIVVKWQIKPEHADDWMSIVGDFTAATRAEPGNLFFDWARSVEDPNEYVLTEAFADGAAGGEHVHSEHFRTATSTLGQYIVARPKIVSQDVPDADGWGEMGEISPQ